MRNTGNKKKISSDFTSKPIKTFEDILEFEDKLFRSSFSKDELKKYDVDRFTGNPTFSSQEELEAYVANEPSFNYGSQYVTKEEGLLIHKDDKDKESMIESGEAIKGDEFIYQKIVGPVREGRNLEQEIPFEPLIFQAKGKTPSSVPYLRVSVSTSVGEVDNVLHSINVKTRSREDE